jgi:hypothetical protein
MGEAIRAGAVAIPHTSTNTGQGGQGVGVADKRDKSDPPL